jgi:hypothetical protein
LGDKGLYMCEYSGSSCPSGWSQYESYFASSDYVAHQQTGGWENPGCDYDSMFKCFTSGGGGGEQCVATYDFGSKSFGDNSGTVCASCSCPSGCGTCDALVSIPSSSYTAIGCC